MAMVSKPYEIRKMLEALHISLTKMFGRLFPPTSNESFFHHAS
jgi:hypothetical protein